MSAVTILVDAVRALPDRLRKALYVVYSLAVVVVGVLEILAVPTGQAAEVLAYLGIPLGLTAAANVQSSGVDHRA